MDVQIHRIETEAYGAVLRAFIAQSEALSWGKEELITELRKELRVSDPEHREILGKVNLDNSIKSIREWRNGANGQQLTAINPSISNPTFVSNVSHKRLKPTPTPMPSSPKCLPRAQPSPVPVSSSSKYLPRAQSSQVPVPIPVLSSPKYLPLSQPSTALVPPSLVFKNGQWSDMAIISPQMPFSSHMTPVSQNKLIQSSKKARESAKSQISNKGLVHFGSENIKITSDIIEIRATDKLINEVEKICGDNPNPSQVERAKLVLREHERALVDAIRKLANMSDDDNSPAHLKKQHPYSNEVEKRNTQEYGYNPDYGNNYMLNNSGRAGIPCAEYHKEALERSCYKSIV